jgi:hypothetical protein
LTKGKIEEIQRKMADDSRVTIPLRKIWDSGINNANFGKQDFLYPDLISL